MAEKPRARAGKKATTTAKRLSEPRRKDPVFWARGLGADWAFGEVCDPIFDSPVSGMSQEMPPPCAARLSDFRKRLVVSDFGERFAQFSKRRRKAWLSHLYCPELGTLFKNRSARKRNRRDQARRFGERWTRAKTDQLGTRQSKMRRAPVGTRGQRTRVAGR